MFGLLVDRYQSAFLRKASYLLGSSMAAEDAVQDTFLKVYRNAGKFAERPGVNFSSWAYKILINTCYDYSRRRVIESGRVKKLEFEELDLLGAAQSENREQASFVNSVLARLPDRLARLLRLYFFEDRSYEEIAAIEKASLSAVKSGLHRAKKQFKTIAVEMT